MPAKKYGHGSEEQQIALLAVDMRRDGAHLLPALQACASRRLRSITAQRYEWGWSRNSLGPVLCKLLMRKMR